MEIAVKFRQGVFRVVAVERSAHGSCRGQGERDYSVNFGGKAGNIGRFFVFLREIFVQSV
jgi:hypothetical protein